MTIEFREMPSTSVEILDDLVAPLSNCFSEDVARQIVALRASPELQARIHEFGEKCDRGDLSDQERGDYEMIVRFTRFISVLQSKARKLLNEGSH